MYIYIYMENYLARNSLSSNISGIPWWLGKFATSSLAEDLDWSIEALLHGYYSRVLVPSLFQENGHDQGLQEV